MIHDFEGDLIAARERADRELERGDSPQTHLWFGPLNLCHNCGYLVREVEPGRWICPCHEWSAA